MDKLSDYLKTLQELAPKFSLGLWLFGVTILLLPSWLTSQLRIKDIIDSNFGIIAILTFGASFLWIFHHGYEILAKAVIRLWARFSTKREIAKSVGSWSTDQLIQAKLLDRRLTYSSAAERRILEFCLNHNQDVVYLDWRNAAAQALCERGVMKKPDLTDRDLSKALIVPFRIDREDFDTMKYIKAQDRFTLFKDRGQPSAELEALFSKWEQAEARSLLVDI